MDSWYSGESSLNTEKEPIIRDMVHEFSADDEQEEYIPDDRAEVVPSWYDFSMTGHKSCQVGTKLARLQYDRTEVVPSWHDFSMTWQKSCLIGTTSAYEVVPIRHDLPKFIIFFKRTPF